MASLYENIVTSLITIMKAVASLAEPTYIKKYFFGAPISPGDVYPYIYVDWVGGPVKPSTAAEDELTNDINIVVVDRNSNVETCEKSVMTFAQTIKDAVDANPTISGNVDDAYVISVDKVGAKDGDYAVNFVRVLVRTVKEET